MQKMSEEIALYCLKADSQSYSEVCEECSIYGNVGCDHCYNDAINMAIKALEEIQQYRAIETELKERYHANVDIKMLMQYFIETIFKDEKHEGFKILTNEDAKMWDAYKAIGTVDQCREALERMKPKKPEIKSDFMEGKIVCPECGHHLGLNQWREEVRYLVKHCRECGQRLDWGEEDE